MFTSGNIQLLSRYACTMIGATKVINQRKTTTVIALLAAAVVMLLSAPLMATNSLHAYGQEVKTLRIGYFPNINHAQAVIGLGKGDFQQTLGK